MTDNRTNQEAQDRIHVRDALSLDSARTFPEPPPPSAVISAEGTALESLVHHRWSVPHDTPFDMVHRLFGERNVDFMALIRAGNVTGLCSRGQLSFMLGSRYGFALFSRSPSHLAQVAHPLVFTCTTPVRQILDSALARKGKEFHEDVILVDENHQLLGLISVEALAHLQSQLVDEQLGELRRQHDLLRQQNLSLFHANHAQRQTQALYQGLFANNPLGIALLDNQGAVQTHNRRFAELLHLGDDQDARHRLVEWVTERERPMFQNLLLAHERQGTTPSTHEFTLHVADHGPRLFRFNTSWINETSQICACIEDISDQRTVERNLRRQEKQLLLDTLVGGIAHELNNKLAPVMGYAELLTPMVDERSQSYVGYITKSVVEAAHIIRQLLQLSKPNSGHPEIVDLRQVVEESLVMLKFKIREAGAQIRTTLPATPANVLSDSAQLKQVFINLAVNALHAMEATVEPELHIAVGQRENTAWMMVRDNGVGIPPESIGRIFDPFFTTKGPDKGTGLGLSICSSIVQKSRGDISVESEPGSGATFTVSFPAANAAAITPAPIGQKTEPSVRPGGWTNYKILVVEDEDVLRRLLQEVLRSQFGCRVDPAANGAEGLVRAMQEQYDLIVSDVRMPELSGVELFLRLREEQPSMARKFIFVSGHVGDEKFDQEIRRCNVPLIAKPFTIAHLTAACLPLLQAARPGAISRH
jgi:signal transduction histidine kinase